MNSTSPSSPDPQGVSPEVVSQLREQLTKGDDVIDPKTWAGSVPAAFGIAPRLRIGAKRWLNLAWLVPIGWVLLLLGVGTAQVLRRFPAVEGFVRRYPGSEFAVRFGTAM